MIEVRLEHSLKEKSPIVVELFEKVIEVKPEHHMKAPSPIEVKLLGREIVVRPEQPVKALSSIFETSFIENNSGNEFNFRYLKSLTHSCDPGRSMLLPTREKARKMLMLLY